MKLTIKEAKPIPAESERPCDYTIIFQGEVDCCQFRCWDTKIATPSYIHAFGDDIQLIYPYPCNIKPTVEGDIYKTLWLKPATDLDTLRGAIAQRVEAEATRQQNLKSISEGIEKQ